MKTIEERAIEYANNNPHGNPYNWNAHYDAYKDGATEQKAIDDAEIERLKVAWSQEAKITHNDEKNYQQGFHDAKGITICKCCSWLCDTCEVEHCGFDGGSKCLALKSLREYMER